MPTHWNIINSMYVWSWAQTILRRALPRHGFLIMNIPVFRRPDAIEMLQLSAPKPMSPALVTENSCCLYIVLKLWNLHFRQVNCEFRFTWLCLTWLERTHKTLPGTISVLSRKVSRPTCRAYLRKGRVKVWIRFLPIVVIIAATTTTIRSGSI